MDIIISILYDDCYKISHDKALFCFVLPSLKISFRKLLINKSLSFPIEISIKDPNTLNLDPDPEFWPNLYPDLSPDPDPGLWYKF